MKKWISNLNWVIILVFCFTIGLAPFSPPHVFEKFIMLIGGDLIKPIDWFDFLLHGTPWILLVLKLILKPSIKTT